MNLKELERPFEESLIRTRQGSHGKILSYVPSAEYVQRLNQASTDGAWDWEILEYKILDDEVVVLGKLTIDGTIKIEFGGSTITRATSDTHHLPPTPPNPLNPASTTNHPSTEKSKTSGIRR